MEDVGTAVTYDTRALDFDQHNRLRGEFDAEWRQRSTFVVFELEFQFLEEFPDVGLMTSRELQPQRDVIELIIEMFPAAVVQGLEITSLTAWHSYPESCLDFTGKLSDSLDLFRADQSLQPRRGQLSAVCLPRWFVVFQVEPFLVESRGC